MRWKTMAAAVLVAASFGCSDQSPTGLVPAPDASLAKGGNQAQTAAAKAALLTDIPISQGSFAGTLSITRIGYDPVARTLLFSGTVTRTVDGVTESFTDVAGALLHGGAATTSQFGANEAGKCDILFLDLGAISLDLLGLELDLSPIQLDLDANPGPGNLLGNLLCALVGLLDGPGLLLQIGQLLDQINAILGGLA